MLVNSVPLLLYQSGSGPGNPKITKKSTANTCESPAIHNQGRLQQVQFPQFPEHIDLTSVLTNVAERFQEQLFGHHGQLGFGL